MILYVLMTLVELGVHTIIIDVDKCSDSGVMTATEGSTGPIQHYTLY